MSSGEAADAWLGFAIGDAVVPRYEHDHDVMTIFDLVTIPGGLRCAWCNWVVGPKDTMHKRLLPVASLERVARKTDA